MGVCTTTYITRKKAIQDIITLLCNVDDEGLAYIMDELFGGERPIFKSQYLLSYFKIVTNSEE